MRRAEYGFTLFEVLGAVALLALVYGTLSAVAIQGLRSEGESQRILKASLLADWALSEVEMGIDQGQLPEVGVTESEEEEFTLTWDVAGFRPPLGSENNDPNGLSAWPRSSGGASLFDDSGTAEASFLQIQLRVSWFEGANERDVTRVTYAVDEGAALNIMAKLAPLPTREPPR
jgi:hypothetical protein